MSYYVMTPQEIRNAYVRVYAKVDFLVALEYLKLFVQLSNKNIF